MTSDRLQQAINFLERFGFNWSQFLPSDPVNRSMINRRMEKGDEFAYELLKKAAAANGIEYYEMLRKFEEFTQTGDVSEGRARRVRMTESQLREVVAESVKRVLREINR